MKHLSCGTGAPLSPDVVRAAMLLRLATFARGTSGVREQLVEALAALLNGGVVPVVPRYGSVGASGDLMPSAYIGRALLGMGQADYQGRRMSAEEALRAAGLKTIRFAPKEGLALINGTTGMTAFAGCFGSMRSAYCTLCWEQWRWRFRRSKLLPSPISRGYTKARAIRARSQWRPTSAGF